MAATSMEAVQEDVVAVVDQLVAKLKVTSQALLPACHHNCIAEIESSAFWSMGCRFPMDRISIL